MNELEKLDKIQSIINSCNTYLQLESCLSFLDNGYVSTNSKIKFKIIMMVNRKMVSIDIPIKSIDSIKKEKLMTEIEALKLQVEKLEIQANKL